MSDGKKTVQINLPHLSPLMTSLDRSRHYLHTNIIGSDRCGKFILQLCLPSQKMDHDFTLPRRTPMISLT